MAQLFLSLAFALFAWDSHAQIVPLHSSLYEYGRADTVQSEHLAFLDKYVEGKRVVFLGEDDHLVSEFNTLKTAIVSYLAERHGFRAVLFESRDGTAFWDSQVDSANVFENLRRTGAIIWPWLVEENRPLFHRASNQRREIGMGGIDITNILTMRNDTSYRDDDLFHQLRSAAYLTDSQKKTFVLVDSTAREAIKVRGDIYKVTAVYGGTRVKYADTPGYRAWIGTLRDIQQRYLTLAKTFAAPTTADEKILDRIIRIRPAVIQTFIDPTCEDRYRDSVMARNLEYYLSEVAPQSRVIVWAHDGHIAKKPFSPTYPSSVGGYLQDSIKKQSFFLSIKHSGLTRQDGSDTAKSSQLHKHTIEHDLARLGTAYFLDLHSRTSAKELRSRYRYHYANGIYYYAYAGNFEPSRFFDAVIYLHRVHRPHYALEDIRAFYEKNFP